MSSPKWQPFFLGRNMLKFLFADYIWMDLFGYPGWALLTHWGQVMPICVIKLTIIGSDNGLSPGRRQAIIWTNAEILLIWPLGTNFSDIC